MQVNPLLLNPRRTLTTLAEWVEYIYWVRIYRHIGRLAEVGNWIQSEPPARPWVVQPKVGGYGVALTFNFIVLFVAAPTVAVTSSIVPHSTWYLHTIRIEATSTSQIHHRVIRPKRLFHVRERRSDITQMVRQSIALPPNIPSKNFCWLKSLIVIYIFFGISDT